MTPTQAERILDLLHVAATDGAWPWCTGIPGGLCGAVLLRAHIPRYAAVIHTMKRRGVAIDTIGTCPRHNTAIYRLAQGQATLPL